MIIQKNNIGEIKYVIPCVTIGETYMIPYAYNNR